MIQLAFRHQREYALRGLMTRLGVCSEIVSCDQGLKFRWRFFRVGATGCLRRELSLPGGLRHSLFLTIHMKNQFARRAHARLWAKVEVSAGECANRFHSDAVHHVEILTQGRERFLIHGILFYSWRRAAIGST